MRASASDSVIAPLAILFGTETPHGRTIGVARIFASSAAIFDQIGVDFRVQGFKLATGVAFTPIVARFMTATPLCSRFVLQEKPCDPLPGCDVVVGDETLGFNKYFISTPPNQKCPRHSY
jgi:hypothetical protein